MKRGHPRVGFTLIELLVALAVIGVLAGLLFPAVQQIRETSRMTECTNQMRQIGFALQSFHTSRRHLPDGWDAAPPPLVDAGLPGWGWASRLLPYIEQDSLYNSIDFAASVSDAKYDSLRETVLSAFICPSDPSPDLLLWANLGDPVVFPFQGFRPHDPPGTGDPGRFVTKSNYSGVFGSNEITTQPLNGNGVFFQNSSIRIKDIADGQGNTLMVGERLATIGTVTWVGVERNIKQGPARVVGSAQYLPNEETGHFEAFRSAHPGVVNFLFADGSVRPLSEMIDINLYHGLSTRNGKEILDTRGL
jgi:prepilin-type N-terminal cleavage/methylation domain-containing protein/prepilin-type processing-associated H-X9-DG protein